MAAKAPSLMDIPKKAVNFYLGFRLLRLCSFILFIIFVIFAQDAEGECFTEELDVATALHLFRCIQN